MEFIGHAWHNSLQELFEAIPLLSARKFDAIEAGIATSSFLDTANALEIECLLKNLELTNLRISSIHSPFGYDVDFSSFDDEVHEKGVASLIDAIELSQLLRAEYLIVHPCHGEIKTDRAKRFDRAVGVIRELAVIAEASDVMLAVENMTPGYLCDEPEELLKMIDLARSSAVGVCFDTGHANLSSDFADQARQLLPYTITMHVHDNDGKTDQHFFPGKGTIDWQVFGRLCMRHCPQVPMLIECSLPDGWDWLQSCSEITRLMGILKETET